MIKHLQRKNKNLEVDENSIVQIEDESIGELSTMKAHTILNQTYKKSQKAAFY